MIICNAISPRADQDLRDISYHDAGDLMSMQTETIEKHWEPRWVEALGTVSKWSSRIQYMEEEKN